MEKYAVGFQGDGWYQCFDMKRAKKAEEMLYAYIERPKGPVGQTYVCNTPECQNHQCNYSQYYRVNLGCGPVPQIFPTIKLYKLKK